MSPVPGGRSTTSRSSPPQSVSRRSWRNADVAIGPRHTTACPGVSIEPIEMNARQLGDFVFVDGRGKFQVESNGQVNDLLLTYLDVWAKRGGSWQMVHWHSARMPPPAAPAPPR